MKAVTVPTIDVSPGVEVKDAQELGEYKWQLEDGFEDYIKRELGIRK